MIESIEADIDNLLLSPTAPPSDTQLEPPTREQTESPPPSTTATEAPSEAPTVNLGGAPQSSTHFPYVLAIHCWLGGGRQATPSDILTAQINTSVHASFIDSALLPHLGVQHRVRNRRPPRYNSSSRFPQNPRPRILLPVYFPLDSSANPASVAESQVAKIQIDFVVVTTHCPPDTFAPVEIGSQALFLHGIDVLFSSRTLKVGGLNIALPQVAPRDQKRLLSSIALGMFVPPQPSAGGWDRPRRSIVAANAGKEDEKGANESGWGEESQTGCLRDGSTNSSFSSSTFPSTAGTALTSPTLTDVDHKEGATGDTNGLPTPPLSGVFSSALQFIPSSVVVTARSSKEESRSRASTIHLDRSQSQASERALEPPAAEEEREVNGDLPPPSADVEDTCSTTNDTLSRKSSFANDSPSEPRLPSTLAEAAFSNNRKASSTWPRSLGKRVAPWTSQSATKASILGTAFGDAPGDVPTVPPRRMRVLKPPARRGEPDLGSPEVGRVELVQRDVIRVEIRENGTEDGRAAGKNVGGGAFHWMK
jgi:hypothetical protein